MNFDLILLSLSPIWETGPRDTISRYFIFTCDLTNATSYLSCEYITHKYDFISCVCDFISQYYTMTFNNLTNVAIFKMTNLYLKMNTWLRMTLFLTNTLYLTTVTLNPTNTTTSHKCELLQLCIQKTIFGNATLYLTTANLYETIYLKIMNYHNFDFNLRQKLASIRT